MIDRATLEKIAYRLKHAAGLYVDSRWTDLASPAATECLDYADILLDYARSSCDDKPITDAYNPATVAETWTDFEPPVEQKADVLGILIFNLDTPEGREQHQLALEGERWKRIVYDLIWEPAEGIRNRLKYELQEGSPYADALYDIKQRIYDLCDREDLILGD